MFLPSAWWDHSTRMLAQPSWTTCGGLNAAIMTGSLLFVTGTAPGVVIALCRPVRLWLHLAAQAVVLAASLPHSGGLCRTPSFQHHTAERMFGRAYALLDWLGLLTPLPTSLLVSGLGCTQSTGPHRQGGTPRGPRTVPPTPVSIWHML